MGTAEISLIGSVAAAMASAGAAVIAYRLGRQRFDHERRLSDVDSARRVLDDAASAMQRTSSSLESLLTRLHTYASPWPGRPWNENLLRNDADAKRKAGDELTSLAGRLRIRFGSQHRLVTVYESAASLVRGVAVQLELMASEAENRGAVLEDPHEVIDRAAREFTRARDLFMLIAYQTVGTNLP
jgi:hypothetical protein